MDKVVITPRYKTTIIRSVFINQDLIVYPKSELYSKEVMGNLKNVIKFLFGEGAYVVEDVTNGYPSFTIKNASYELRKVSTINANWIVERED